MLSETNTNDTLSPALRCINLRTSAGIVTCPLTDIVEVMEFSFVNSGMIAFPCREVKRESKACKSLTTAILAWRTWGAGLRYYINER